MAVSRQSKEPCKKEACDIQACLTKSNFNPQRSTEKHFEVKLRATKATQAAVDDMTIISFRGGR